MLLNSLNVDTGHGDVFLYFIVLKIFPEMVSRLLLGINAGIIRRYYVICLSNYYRKKTTVFR